MNTRTVRLRGICALAVLAACPRGSAQFTIAGHEIQVHGFFSQGFLYSDENNYLTAPTSQGTFRLTDGGLNISSQLTSKFRVGAQAYVRNVGQLGKGHVTLDWAFGDYRLHDRFGIRAGRIKTVLGLYNDTQDLEFLHTWALLPQSLYPIDLRGFSISHLGGDLYGTLRAKRAGGFAYTVYAGQSPPDLAGGMQHGLASYGIRSSGPRGSMIGGDLKWTTPMTGLLIGSSFLRSKQFSNGTNEMLGGTFRSDAILHTLLFSAQYSRGPWRIEWERSRATTVAVVQAALDASGPVTTHISYDIRGWYSAAAFRFSKYLEVGSYHSRFYPNADRRVSPTGLDQPPAARHIYDQALTARFDIKSYWDIKVEGHLMDGYGDPGTSRGFYPQDTPTGLQPKTKLLVIRLGFNR